MRYLSLFSGIGAFEYGIACAQPTGIACAQPTGIACAQPTGIACAQPASVVPVVPTCLGFSEIDVNAIKIYKHHYPDHNNLGDITKITEDDISSLGKIDLIISGFPCTNLSSMARFQGNSKGLEGPKSGLFFDMVRVMKYAQKKNKNLKIIVENNNSMSKDNKELITTLLKDHVCPTVRMTCVNNAVFAVQSRRRLIWTNFELDTNWTDEIQQTWDDVLETGLVPICSDKMVECLNKLHDVKNTSGKTKIAVKDNGTWIFKTIDVKNKKSRWDIQSRSDNMSTELYKYPVGKSRPITTGCGGGNNCLIDRRRGGDDWRIGENGICETHFIFRPFTCTELERLFGFPDGYTDVNGVSKGKRAKALGNSIPVFITRWVLKKIL
jgi:DNA-cytosine methyltransferase